MSAKGSSSIENASRALDAVKVIYSWMEGCITVAPVGFAGHMWGGWFAPTDGAHFPTVYTTPKNVYPLLAVCGVLAFVKVIIDVNQKGYDKLTKELQTQLDALKEQEKMFVQRIQAVEGGQALVTQTTTMAENLKSNPAALEAANKSLVEKLKLLQIDKIVAEQKDSPIKVDINEQESKGENEKVSRGEHFNNFLNAVFIGSFKACPPLFVGLTISALLQDLTKLGTWGKIAIGGTVATTAAYGIAWGASHYTMLNQQSVNRVSMKQEIDGQIDHNVKLSREFQALLVSVEYFGNQLTPAAREEDDSRNRYQDRFYQSPVGLRHRTPATDQNNASEENPLKMRLLVEGKETATPENGSPVGTPRSVNG